MTTARIFQEIEGRGFHVSAHCMREYVELHAVPASYPDGLLHLARSDGGDDEAHVHATALELVRMVGADVPT